MSLQTFFKEYYVRLSDRNKLFLMQTGFKFEDMDTVQWHGTCCTITTKSGMTINLADNTAP